MIRNCMPTVTTMELARRPPTMAPFTPPTSVAMTRGRMMASAVRGPSTGPISMDRTAAIVTMAPTERSKLPPISTNVTPTARSPTIVACRRMLRRLLTVRKLSETRLAAITRTTRTGQIMSIRARRRGIVPRWGRSASGVRGAGIRFASPPSSRRRRL